MTISNALSKTLLSAFILASASILPAAWASQVTPRTLQPGDPAPALGLNSLLQAPAGSQATWDALKGNVVVLEFWATWCGPCRAAIPHLNELTEAFKDRPVRFISITDEDEWRVRNFLKVTPIRGWIGLDPARSAHTACGVLLIPHTVLVGRDGRIAAILQPSEVTADVLNRLLAGQPVRPEPGPKPSPIPTSPAGQATPSVAKAENAPPPALVEMTIREAPRSNSMSFSGESFRARGMPLKDLIAQAFGVSAVRVQGIGFDSESSFEVTARVPREQREELRPLLQQAIKAAVGIGVRRETREMDVLVLAVSDSVQSKLRPGNSREERPLMSDAGQISGTATSIGTFRVSLENTLGRIVLDETRLEGLYDLALYWDPKRPDSVIAEIRDQLGLELRPAKRPIEVLTFEKKRTANDDDTQNNHRVNIFRCPL